MKPSGYVNYQFIQLDVTIVGHEEKSVKHFALGDS